MEEQPSANDILAFCVIFCNTQLPFDYARNMSLSDPLYSALHKALKNKRRIEDERTGRICAVIASCNSSKRFSAQDFMLQEPKSQAEKEAEIQRNFDMYATLAEKGLIK
jgi:predicted phosphoadenosine phosphosulfate sulfurtransferase